MFKRLTMYLVCVALYLLFTGCVDTIQSTGIERGWEYHLGFDTTWLQGDSVHNWKPLQLPGSFTLDKAFKNFSGPVTVRCNIDSLLDPLLKTDEPLAFRSGRGADIVFFYLDTMLLGQVGSLSPYTPGVDQEFIKILPAEARDQNSSHYLTAVYYTRGSVGFFGMRTVPRIGISSTTHREYYKEIIIGFLFLGIFGIIGLYHLVLGVLRTKDIHNLYFGFFCSAFTLFIATNTAVRKVLFFNMPFLLERADLISVMSMGTTLPLFICQLFRGNIIPFLRIYMVFIIACMFPVIFGDIQTGHFIRSVWEFTLPVPTIFMLIFSSYHAIKGNHEARVVGFGLILFVLAGIHDLLAFKGLLEFSLLLPVAFVLFVAGVAVLLIQRFVTVHNKMESLNEDLEKRVSQRTVELQSSIEERDRILGIVAHDLRNPLGAILSSVNLLEELKDEDPESSAECLKIINQAVYQATSNIESLLSMARLDESVKTLTTEETDLSDFLQPLFSLYNARTKEKKITFEYSVPSEKISVNLNKSMFTRVIDNLLSNAIKFTPDHGTITLTVTPQIHTVRISINDTGIGIPESLKYNVFQRFGPSCRPGTNNEQSTGLGLSIVKTVVERHGGRVWFESKEDHGTTFHVEILRGNNTP